MNNYQLSTINLKTKKYFNGLIFVYCILVIGSTLFAEDADLQRIVSLGPAITRQLSLLEAEDKIVGVTMYCEVKGKEVIGTITDANAEKILMLKPDIVIATGLTDIKTIQELKNLNIDVVVFDEIKNFQQLCKQFLQLARLAGKEEIGSEIVLSAEKKVLGLSLKNKDLPKKKVIVQIGANPLWVAAKNSLINNFIELAGGINLGPDGENGLVSREYVVRHNPDVIIIIEMGILADEEKANWMKLGNINAVKQKRIYIFNAYDICSPTPLSFVETLKEISRILYSEME
ncbi:MAG: ABC transporter substrate-binding protein [Candidatus Ratteibacteria bacterium]|nr:ABC transporter substrate-binding protein [Candidatus Ratteibacteria bacterium]